MARQTIITPDVRALLEKYPFYSQDGKRGEGFRYDYFNLSELESLDLYGGLVHVERDESFNPRKLSEIAEVVASCSGIWQVEAENGIEND